MTRKNTTKELERSKKNPKNTTKLAPEVIETKDYTTNQVCDCSNSVIKNTLANNRNDFLEVYGDVLRVTNEGLEVIVNKLVKQQYKNEVLETLATHPLYITVSTENVGNKKRFLSVEDTLKVTNKDGLQVTGMVLNTYVDEQQNPLELVLRLVTALGCYMDYMRYETHIKGAKDKDGNDIQYKPLHRKNVPWKRGQEIYSIYTDIKLEKHPKIGTLLSLVPGYDTTWVETLFNTNGKLEYSRKTTESKPKTSKVKVGWACECEKCKAMLPTLASISEKKVDNALFKTITLKCEHGLSIKFTTENENQESAE